MVSDVNKANLVQRVEQLTDNGVLSEINKRILSKEFKIPLSAVESVATFYSHSAKADKICTGLPCVLKSSLSRDSVKKENMDEVSCLGYCDHAPVTMIEGKYYTGNDDGISEIMESTVDYVSSMRVGIREYIDSGGYSALYALNRPDGASRIMEKISKSNLRGMGGAGFPAYMKWKSLPEERGSETYLLVNAHEGEPGTFKDRGILELEPHSLLEGAIIASVVNRIDSIIVGMKSEYIVARWSMEKAVEELEATFSRDGMWDMIPEIEIVSLGGSYVTGEETALMEAIEGRRSEPRLRPPFPTVRGLYGKPTLVHNVETLSLIPGIVSSGGESMQKRYCVTGDVKSPGIVTTGLGISARDLLSEKSGTDYNSVKAFMPGGLSGGILPSSELDLKLDNDSLKRSGVGLGTGAFIALSEERCMVDVALSVSRFFEVESCGKCAPCRLGTHALTSILQRISLGKSNNADLDKAREMAGMMLQGSICALGQAAGKMFLDSVLHFSEEYDQHLAGNCPTGVCVMDGGE